LIEDAVAQSFEEMRVFVFGHELFLYFRAIAIDGLAFRASGGLPRIRLYKSFTDFIGCARTSRA
jgi:hypothetical protein